MRRLLLPAISTAIMLAILIGLGVWQLERMAWKQGLLDQIARAEAQPAIDLPDTPPAFAKIRVAGNFRDDLWSLYGAQGRDMPQGTLMGGQLLGVLDRPSGAVLVDLGWVPNSATHPKPGPAVVEGFIRPAEHPGLFAATDDLRGRRFYTLNPEAIGTALGVKLAPFTLVAIGPPGVPDPSRALPRPANDHFGYALTWFSFAAILAIIFALHARRTLRP
jgi:surfeit locus 1 family protein